MNKPLVSVIVSVRNGERTLEKCVSSLLAIYPARPEIIFIDDASVDATPQILNRYSDKIIILRNDVPLGPAASRNKAAAAANGFYLAFTDADCIVDGQWLEELLRCFEAFGDLAGCGGSQKLPLDATSFEKDVFYFMQRVGFLSEYVRKDKSASIVKVRHNPSCNSLYRKDVFLREGGFMKGLWPGEDVEFDYRLGKKGYSLACNPRAVVFHSKPSSAKLLSRMMFRYGFAQGILVKKYGFFRPLQYVALYGIAALMVFASMAYMRQFLFLLISAASILLAGLFFFGARLRVLHIALISLYSWNLGFLKSWLIKTT